MDLITTLPYRPRKMYPVTVPMHEGIDQVATTEIVDKQLIHGSV